MAHTPHIEPQAVASLPPIARSGTPTRVDDEAVGAGNPWLMPLILAAAVIGWCWLGAAIVEMVAPV